MEKVNIDFANFNYVFYSFHLEYKNKCEEVSSCKRSELIKIKNNPIKKISALIYEYLVNVKSQDVRDNITEKIRDLQDKVFSDKEYERLMKKSSKSASENSKYNKMYFRYIIDLYTIIGEYGDELTSTFMPTKSDRKKFIKYTNTNTFFEKFTEYKSKASQSIANFSILEFRETFVHFLGFYFAYYLFIDLQTRDYTEKLFSMIINIYTHEEVTGLLLKGYNNLGSSARDQLKDYDNLIHKALTKIFLACNISYSNYGVIPKIIENVKFDDTLI